MAKTNVAPRNPADVLKKIKRFAPKKLRKALNKRMAYCAPELVWEVMTECVNAYVNPSSKSLRSVAVYAALCGCSWKEMRHRFEMSEAKEQAA